MTEHNDPQSMSISSHCLRLVGAFSDGCRWLVIFGAICLVSLGPSLAAASITFLQSEDSTQDSAASTAATYTAVQTAGDLNVVIVAWEGAGTCHNPSCGSCSRANPLRG